METWYKNESYEMQQVSAEALQNRFKYTIRVYYTVRKIKLKLDIKDSMYWVLSSYKTYKLQFFRIFLF